MKKQQYYSEKLIKRNQIHSRFFVTPGMIHKEIRRSMSASVQDETFVVPWQMDDKVKQAPSAKKERSDDMSHLWNSF